MYNAEEGGKHACYTVPHPPAITPDDTVVPIKSKSRKKWFICMGIVVVIIIIAVCVPVGVEASKNKR